MDLTAVGPVNGPSRASRRGTHQSNVHVGASASLPPLQPNAGDLPASPRRDVAAPRSSRQPILRRWKQRDKPQSQQGPDESTQVAAWPLTFAAGSSIGRSPSSISMLVDSSSGCSPVSPKTRKLQARVRLVDDSRTRPALLQELQSFLQTELGRPDERGEIESDANPMPSLRRLQVVREALGRLIAGFSVYAPVLTRIRDEYERALSVLRARTLALPGLQSRLQSVETHCLLQLGASSAEAKTRSLALKQRLAQTQAMLAASAAECASLRVALREEQVKLAQSQGKHAELQNSTLTLASSVRRHDESLRAGHQRSLEDARALQQVTARYYHACDELAELKQTVAALEEQGSGEHVAADRSTIALLTRELQELTTAMASAAGPAASSHYSTSKAQEEAEASHSALNHAFVRALDAVGLSLELSDLLETIRNAPSVPEAIDSTSSGLIHKLRQLQQQQHALTSADSKSSTVFLTEPAELQAFNPVVATQLLSSTGSTPTQKRGGDFLAGRGLGSDIPEYMQHDGLVRNLFFARTKVEQMVSRIWDQLDDLTKARRNGDSTTPPPVTPLLTSSTPLSPLEQALVRFLQGACSERSERIEVVYNLEAGLQRFSAHSSACRLFLLVLMHELPVEARADQSRELSRLHDALLALDRDRHSSSLASGAASSSTLTPGALPPGRVTMADVVQTLRLTFPWKDDAALTQLHRALLSDLRGQTHVDYAALLSTPPPAVAQVSRSGLPGGFRAGQPNARWQFGECLRMQHLDDLLAFRHRVQRHIRTQMQSAAENECVSESAEESAAAAQMISLRDLRACLLAADPATPEQDLVRVLTAVSALSARELLTHDDMVLDARQILRRLPTLLLRPTGRVNET